MDNRPLPRRAGRPTRQQAEDRHRAMLDKALELFAEQGFERTPLRDVAATAGLTRKTILMRYADKGELFCAALEQAAARIAVPPEDLAKIDMTDLEKALIEVARLWVAATLAPDALRLQRLLQAESSRFPEQTRLAIERICGPAIAFIVHLLRYHGALGTTVAEEPERAAAAFMDMIDAGVLRRVLMGTLMGCDETEQHIHFSVKLFVNGIGRR